jgi:hypothetical protein
MPSFSVNRVHSGTVFVPPSPLQESRLLRHACLEGSGRVVSKEAAVAYAEVRHCLAFAVLASPFRA